MLRHFLLIFLCVYSSAANAAWYNPAWNYRTKITIQAASVNGTVTELPVFVDLSHLPGSFFDNVSANGTDLRVTSSDGSTEIAREVVSLSKTANTGELWFKAPSLSSAANTEFYIYYGNNTASEPLANSTFGSQNVWSNGFVAVYHMNAVTNGTASVLDSTSSAYHGTPRGGMATLGSGIAGNAIAFDGSNDFISSGIAFSNPERTICSWVNHTNKDTPGTQRYLSLTNEANVLRQQAAGFTQYMFNQSAVFYGASENSTVNNTWYYFCGVWDASTGLAYRNANQVISYAFTGLPRNVGSLSISTGAETMNGRIDEVKISTKARNRNWIQTEYNNQNSPLSFYTLSAEQGSLTEFPHRLNVTINASQVNGSVTQMPVFINLDHMPQHFFTNVKGSGADIRMTTSDGVSQVPVEIVSLDKATTNGEIWFRAPSLTSASDTVFYLYYGLNGATLPAASSSFGSQNVWSNGFVAVYHMNALTNGIASVLDSTSFANHGTPFGGMTGSNIVAGRTGNAINFDGSNDRVQIATNITNTSFNFSTWFKTTTAADLKILSLDAGNHPLQVMANNFRVCLDIGLCTTTGPSVSDNTWKFASVNSGGSAFINATSLFSAGTKLVANYTTANIGAVGGAAMHFFLGQVE